MSLIEHLPANAQETWRAALELLAAGPLIDVAGKKSIALIPVGNIQSET